MYIPVANRMNDRPRLIAFMQQYDFAILVTNGPDGLPAISYAPVMVEADDASIQLSFHLARANDHNELLKAGTPTTVIFRGPHAFISPTWYASPNAVPTWNYTVVHASGTCEVMPDPDTVMPMLNDLTHLYDRTHPDYTQEGHGNMLPGIVAYRMTVTTLEGKFKLGQNRPLADRVGMRQKLEASRRDDSRALAAIMKEFEPE